MKKEINKLLIVLGFCVALIAVALKIVISSKAESALTIASSSTLIVLVLAVTFVFAKNAVVSNIGYCLSILTIVDALYIFMFESNDMRITYAIGLTIMAAGALIRYLILLLAFCGFVKEGKTCSSDKKCHSDMEQLLNYKELLQDNILTEEEFSNLKRAILTNDDKKGNSFDDLKKWKKLLDQQVITAEEFASIKNGIIRA